MHFRQGRHHVNPHQMILKVADTAEDADTVIGKVAMWKSPVRKEIKGKISDAHGNNGLVRAIFEKGLPGQARNSEVEVK